MRPYGSPAQLEQRRFQAASLFEHGFTPVDIAKKLNVERRSVRRWKSAYLKKGVKGITAKPVPGRPSRMSNRNKARLERELLRGAIFAGYATELWTCPRIADFIKKKFRIHYHPRYLPRLLRSLGWSIQKPERRAKERNERAIARWIKTDWEAIKKKPKN